MSFDLYLDCQSGISGNMFLGALIDLGLPATELEAQLRRLPITEHWDLVVEPCRRASLSGTHAEFRIVDTHAGHAHPHHDHPHHDHPHHDHPHHDHPHHDHPHHGRHLPEIERLIRDAHLPDEVTSTALKIFTRLAEAEAAVHGTTIEQVHFHEVGAVDSILDIVGAAVGLHLLGIRSVRASTICEGHGTVHCAHGTMPIPVPAVIKLLEGVPLRQIDIEAELVTPTGAALLAVLAEGFGPLDGFIIEKSGAGCGTREWPHHPNLLRAYLGRHTAPLNPLPRESVTLLTTNLDQSSGEILGDLLQQLMNAGALDACLLPILMKKGRPAHQLQVLCAPGDEANLARLVFTRTGTLGIRRQTVERWALERSLQEVRTPWGMVRMKAAVLGDLTLPPHPEYDDCLKIAEAEGLPLREVMEAARRVAELGS